MLAITVGSLQCDLEISKTVTRKCKQKCICCFVHEWISLCVCVLKVIEELQTAPMNNDEKELLQLLSTPHLRVNDFLS